MAAVSEQSFREDLYYRLNVIQLEIPPLRERLDDLALLISNVLSSIAEHHTISSSAMNILEALDLAGNVRELQNVLRRACVLCDEEITEEFLPPSLVQHAQAFAEQDAPVTKKTQTACLRLGDLALFTLDELEFTAIRQAMTTFGGDRGKMAQSLGIDRTTLYRKLKKYVEQGRMPDQ